MVAKIFDDGETYNQVEFVKRVNKALRQIEWVGVGCCEAMVPGKEANDGSARAVFSGVRVGSTVVGG